MSEERLEGGSLPLHVESSGHAPGAGVETFLLIHGYGASTFTWRHWAPRLAARGHVLLVDMKGFGRAAKPDDGRYSPEHQAEHILRLIAERDLRRLTLVGHSLGGGVALLTALGLREEAPNRLERLVVVSGAAYEQRLPPFVRLADHPRASSLLFRLLGPKLVVRAVLRSIVYDRSRVEGEQVRGYAAPMVETEALRALIDSARQIRPERLEQLTARYPQLSVPALLLWGRHDRVVPLWVGERLERELMNARLHVLERCGHLPAEELPEESWAALEAFLDAS
ncbi:MAG TPA: alpha/beta hydrolase [Longimicrobiales bacterium]|nr:alpha/beta hydrolase [Longimicrobiales bacterium]